MSHKVKLCKQIIVKQLNSFVDFTLEVDLTDTTEVLMEKIELHTGMPPEKQMLHCQGKDLEKGCTLKDQNIKFGSAIILNFRLGASGVTSISSFFKKGTSSNETSKHAPPNDSNLGEQIITLG